MSLIKKRDDRGSLPLAMLLVVVGLGLSGVLASMVNTQIQTTRATAQRSDALDAAQTGLQVGLAQVRAAAGVRGNLPCGVTWSGLLNGATRQTYSVTLYYLAARPPAGNVAWAAARALGCSALSTARYVLIVATGKAFTTNGGRTVTATYPLRTASRDDNGGGLVHLFGPTTPDLCFAAPSAAPAAGAALTMQVCDAASRAQQFAYTSDLNLVLVATREDGSAGMCLDAASTAGTPVQFQTCQTSPLATRQQWSYNATHNFQTTQGRNLCFWLSAPGTPGSAVVLSASCGGAYSTSGTFTPDATVGAGSAGAANQLVDFGQYSTCVSNDTTAGMVVMKPCTQSGTVAAADTWTFGAAGQITTAGSGGVTYCLVSPGSTVAGQYVTVAACPAVLPASMIWTRRGATGLFATAYRIESSYGGTFCLAPTDPSTTPSDPFLQAGTSRLVVAGCTASALQKWNAPASVLRSPLIDVAEN